MCDSTAHRTHFPIGRHEEDGALCANDAAMAVGSLWCETSQLLYALDFSLPPGNSDMEHLAPPPSYNAALDIASVFVVACSENPDWAKRWATARLASQADNGGTLMDKARTFIKETPAPILQSAKESRQQRRERERRERKD